MGAFLKQAGSLLVGQMAGSNNKAQFIVKTGRVAYCSTAAAIAVIWYSAYRNERVSPGEVKFPIPFVSGLQRVNPPDRPETEIGPPAPSESWGNSKNNTPTLYGSGTYLYPFTSTAVPGRIDQGQDFGGTGPIMAIGRCRILKVGAPGWPGGENGVLYQLLDGSRAGQIIYVYEGIKVTVRQHDIIEAGHVIGQFIPFSSTGIEIGFADSTGTPLALPEYAGKPDGTPTKWGREMQAFLRSLSENKKPAKLKGSKGGR